MNAQELVAVMERAMISVLLVGGPIVIVALLIGLVVSVFQAATQINEATLTFVPKVVTVAILLVVLGPWMVSVLIDLTRYVFDVATHASPVYGG
jgi:flagellar biosynthetic protein FliQ